MEIKNEYDERDLLRIKKKQSFGLFISPPDSLKLLYISGARSLASSLLDSFGRGISR